jgi:hypothetical protein
MDQPGRLSVAEAGGSGRSVAGGGGADPATLAVLLLVRCCFRSYRMGAPSRIRTYAHGSGGQVAIPRCYQNKVQIAAN